MNPNPQPFARVLPSTLARAAGVLLIGAWLAFAGCTVEKTGEPETWPKPDPSAQPARIMVSGNGFEVDPPVLQLSLANRDRAQWFNESDSTVTIALVGSPLVFEIAPRGYSEAFRVNPRADTMKYDYKVFGLAGDAPQPPQIEVGP